jgi:flagellar M-ring protein FliF
LSNGRRRIRPVAECCSRLRGSSRYGPAHAAALPGHAHALAANAGGNSPVVPLLENYDLPPAGSTVDVLVDHLKDLAAKEPERVAEVVKQWVQKNGNQQH